MKQRVGYLLRLGFSVTLVVLVFVVSDIHPTEVWSVLDTLTLPWLCGAAVLVDPEDDTSIAEGIRRLGTDADLRDRLRHCGYARVREFSWTRCARETLDVLEAAVA